jgi:DNA-directed RNA polymerase subunit RPC12/RpoP
MGESPATTAANGSRLEKAPANGAYFGEPTRSPEVEMAYTPCVNCGDETSETIEQQQGWLCEDCHNGLNCGCKDCVDIMLHKATSKP